MMRYLLPVIRLVSAITLVSASAAVCVADDDWDDDNPAVFVAEDGADLWLEPQGPNAVSLEGCDLGLGAGVVEGAYARFPRYFADADRVMDLEARLVWCMVSLQGRDAQEITAHPYSEQGETEQELESLSTWIAEQSRGEPINPPQDHPAEQAAYALGKDLFFYRTGSHDFACSTCHRQSDKRIRLQPLANLTTAEGAAEAYSGWPAYRVSQGVVRTMGWRMRDCARQQRLPEMQVGSEASVALQMFMAINAEGAAMAAPGMRR